MHHKKMFAHALIWLALLTSKLFLEQKIYKGSAEMQDFFFALKMPTKNMRKCIFPFFAPSAPNSQAGKRLCMESNPLFFFKKLQGWKLVITVCLLRRRLQRVIQNFLCKRGFSFELRFPAPLEMFSCGFCELKER
jgi:hypothetical protein